ncbi:MAG: nickel pincer cofactor biosynthesis protein LarC [Thermodesulfobacteriota bacterium]|nr:nickel pincer cofactor biosynthesis protein LarC [Thermodesulfobacteriota bacterium]
MCALGDADKNNKKVAFLDCFSGISGNMLLGALLHAGLPEEVLRTSLAALQIPDWQLEIGHNTISGLQACCVRVQAQQTIKHRHLHQIRAILEQSALPKAVITISVAVFTRLAEAEAHVHGTTVEKIHFHEVGAVDAIIDIVGAVSGFHYLGIKQITCSPLPMPGGWVACQHGKLPLPAPAVCDLLRNIPVYGDSLAQELVTPTGAALVAELAGSFGSMPPMILEQTGYGAGTMQRKDGRPNLLRLMIGRCPAATEAHQVEIIETHLDDWNPELWPHVSEMLMQAGALDVSLTPMLMKKGRPGFLLRLISDLTHGARLKEIILNETSSIGLRFHTMQRMTLPREIVKVDTPWGPVQAKKVVTAAGSRVTPEFEDCRRLAEEQDIPLQKIYAAVAKQVET